MLHSIGSVSYAFIRSFYADTLLWFSVKIKTAVRDIVTAAVEVMVPASGDGHPIC
jgi:hypothetical protein